MKRFLNWSVSSEKTAKTVIFVVTLLHFCLLPHHFFKKWHVVSLLEVREIYSGRKSLAHLSALLGAHGDAAFSRSYLRLILWKAIKLCKEDGNWSDVSGIQMGSAGLLDRVVHLLPSHSHSFSICRINIPPFEGHFIASSCCVPCAPLRMHVISELVLKWILQSWLPFLAFLFFNFWGPEAKHKHLRIRKDS